jgi:8-oxo-dGTP pyrophosphatase MutT (NUDIX family)
MMVPVIEQAGAVVFRKDDEGMRVVLVRARKNPSDWIFPKGHIEPDESAEQTAVREAEEEAGVTGHVVGPVEPRVRFTAGGCQFEVVYFVVEFERDVKPKERREQVWLPPAEALDRLTHESAREVLRQALSVFHRAG